MDVSEARDDLRYVPITGDMHDFCIFMEMYTEAFPPSERLDVDYLIGLKTKRDVRFDVVYDGDEMVGMDLTFFLQRTTFVGFLAVRKGFRSKGYGTMILAHLGKERPSNTMVLNVEPTDVPCGNMDQRLARERFYRRNGFDYRGYRLRIDEDVFRVMSTAPDLDEYLNFASEMQWGIMKD